ncbi:MAG: SIMPL domain-containing protein [Planctomycetota bacterium]
MACTFGFAGSDAVCAGELSVAGSAEVPLTVNKIRLQLLLKVTKENAKEALAELRNLRAEAKKKLLSLKAEEASIKFINTNLVEGGDTEEKQRKMQIRAMRMQMQGRGIPDPTEDAPQVVASSTVIADWVVPVTEGDAIILLRARVNEKIRELDVAGKRGRESTENQADAAMEMMQMGMMFGDEDNRESKIGFVATVDDTMRAEALKQAIKKAKQSASQLAGAAQLELGAIKSIASNESYAFDTEFNYYESDDAGFEADENEVVNESLDDLEFVINVQMVFEVSAK